MKHRAVTLLSWLLVVGGVTLAGLGLYNYFLARLSQMQAQREWVSPSDSEQPVPVRPPSAKTGKAPAYYDPYRLGDTVAKLTLPGVEIPLFVVEGTDQKELRKGPGHMPGTALPGVAGNCVIAGHRDTHFRALEGIRQGDQVELETKYGNFRYGVRSVQIVSPTDVASLYPTDKAVLHLITCYPFQYVGHAPKRMVIEAALETQASSGY